MAYSIIAILLAFLWLLYETRLLTVRLFVGKLPDKTELIKMIPTIIIAGMVIASIFKGFGINKPKDKWKVLFKKWLDYKIG